MKNLKKVLSLVLACATAFTVMAGATFTDQSDIKTTEAVDMLNQLGVINGYTDGSYKPDATVTRAEMAKMIYVARTGSTDASSYANVSTTFTDIKGHWAAGFIKYCQTNGIIAGKSATTFAPDETVTGTQAAKMLLVTMGYDANKAGLIGSSWSTNTLNLASDNNLLEDVNADMTAALPRQYAAQLIYNTLKAYRVKWSTDSNSFDYYTTTNGSKETVGEKYLKLDTNVGVLAEINGKNLTIDLSSTDKQHDNNGDFSNVSSDYSALLGEKVKVMFKDDKHDTVLGVYATDDNVVYNVNASAVEDDSAKVKWDGKSYQMDNADVDTGTGVKPLPNVVHAYYTDIKGNVKEAYLASNKAYDEKGTQLSTSPFANTYGDSNNPNTAWTYGFKDLDNVSDTIKFVDSDNNGKLDTAIITEQRAGEVTYVSDSKVTVAGAPEDYDPENDDVASGLTSDDWAVITYNRYKDAPSVQKADMTSGTLSSTKTDSTDDSDIAANYKQYKIDGTWYNAASAGDYSTWLDLKTVNPTCKVQAVIVGGVVYKIKKTSSTGSSDTLDNVALIVKKEQNVSGNQVKLQFFDDTTKVVTVDDDSDLGYGALTEGKLYEYSVSDDKYSFTDLTATDDYYGNYTYLGDGKLGDGTTGTASQFDSQVTATKGDQNGNSFDIDDDAQVIIFSKTLNSDKTTYTYDSDVISGKEFTGLSPSGNVTMNGMIGAFKAEMSGLDKIGAMAVQLNTVSNLGSKTYDNYGYIVNAAGKSGTNAISYTIWDGSKNVDVTQTGTSDYSSYKKGMVVGYSSIDSNNNIQDVTLLKSPEIQLYALTGVSDAKDKVATNSGSYDIKSSSHVMYVDSDNDDNDSIGVSSGTLRKANDDSTQTNANYKGKKPNALLITVSDKVELLIVDTANDFANDNCPYYTAQTTPSVSAALATTGTDSTSYGTETKAVYNVATSNVTVPAVGLSITATATGSLSPVISGGVDDTHTSTTGTAAVTVDVPNNTAPGTYIVTITVSGTYVATKTITVTPITLAAADIVVSNAPTTYSATPASNTAPTVTTGTAKASISAITVTPVSVATMGSIASGDTVKLSFTLTPATGYVFSASALPAVANYTASLDTTTGIVTYTSNTNVVVGA